ncbi:putative reverse transcriptase domain-containing protein [Tanacetum coccineum]
MITNPESCLYYTTTVRCTAYGVVKLLVEVFTKTTSDLSVHASLLIGMERGFLSSKGSEGGRGVKEKNGVTPFVKDGVTPSVMVASGNCSGTQDANSDTGTGLVMKSDRIVAATKVVSPSVVDETMAKEKQSSLVYITGSGSYPPLPTGNGIDVVVSVESIRAISKRFANTAYGFFLGKRVAYLVVSNYVRNTWGSMDGLDSMLENGLWFICNILLILKKWHSDKNLLKEDVSTVPVWVKLDGVLVKVFSKDELSAITTKHGTPLMLDSYTSDMCMQSWGRSSYVRAMIELRTDVNLKDNIMAAMSKITREGTIHVSKSNPFDVLTSVENDVELGTNGGTISLASQEAHSSRSSFWNVNSSSPSTTHVIEKIDKIEKLIIDGKVTLVDDEGKPLEKVDYSGDYDSEDEVASVDNEMDSLLAKKDGYGTQSLLEQWKEYYENGDYEYDPYDDDMYEVQDIPDKLQAICDNLDIKVRGLKKK